MLSNRCIDSVPRIVSSTHNKPHPQQGAMCVRAVLQGGTRKTVESNLAVGSLTGRVTSNGYMQEIHTHARTHKLQHTHMCVYTHRHQVCVAAGVRRSTAHTMQGSTPSCIPSNSARPRQVQASSQAKASAGQVRVQCHKCECSVA